MANSLLDFVMGLVRDPDAAARYAADPAGALADAHLTDVTTSDVNNLIPMVADSMSIATAGAGMGLDGGLSDGGLGNVWTSGAATAALDAFDTHIPGDSIQEIPAVVDEHEPALGDLLEYQRLEDSLVAPLADPIVDLLVDDVANWHDSVAGEPLEPVQDWHPGTNHPGFDPTP